MDTFDHLPTTEELLATYQQSEQSDPRSITYDRPIVRPRIPFGWLFLNLLIVIVVCVGACLLLSQWTERVGWYVLACFVVVAVGCFVFAKRLVILAIRIYQAIAPEKVRKRCRYEPSCSTYMILAIEKYGLWRGVKKGLKRWHGCKPPNGGFDWP